jgi:hypothetical protein
MKAIRVPGVYAALGEELYAAKEHCREKERCLFRDLIQQELESDFSSTPFQMSKPHANTARTG